MAKNDIVVHLRGYSESTRVREDGTLFRVATCYTVEPVKTLDASGAEVDANSIEFALGYLRGYLRDNLPYFTSYVALAEENAQVKSANKPYPLVLPLDMFMNLIGLKIETVKHNAGDVAENGTVFKADRISYEIRGFELTDESILRLKYAECVRRGLAAQCKMIEAQLNTIAATIDLDAAFAALKPAPAAKGK